VILDLRHRWADGTTYLVFEPLELLERLAALTPRPRINLLLYYGVLGARSAWRSRIGETEPQHPTTRPAATGDGVPSATAINRPRTNWLWAELTQRSFGFDVVACPRCGDHLELIALVDAACDSAHSEPSRPAHRGTCRTPRAAATAADRPSGCVRRRSGYPLSSRSPR
jgi:hypothetical protein